MINKDSNNNKDIKKEPVNWYLVDAKDQILGRLSSFLATRLMGKHKVSYSDNTCLKDKIIVINAQKVVLTGKKIHKKKYWHTGYPGGIKNKTFKEILNSNNLYATCKRKNSVARVWLVPNGKGEIKINKKPINEYFSRSLLHMLIKKPFEIINNNNFNVIVSVKGGGLSGQANAIKLAISKALVNFDQKFRVDLKKKGLLTRDSRVVERKKYGRRKARRSFQFSKR